MAIKIKIRVAGAIGYQELELPENIEVRDVQIETQGLQATFEAPDKGWRSGRVSMQVKLNELDDPAKPPEISATFGETISAEGVWRWRSDALMYSPGLQYTSKEHVIAKNMTNGQPWKEHRVVTKAWRSPYYDK